MPLRPDAAAAQAPRSVTLRLASSHGCLCRCEMREQDPGKQETRGMSGNMSVGVWCQGLELVALPLGEPQVHTDAGNTSFLDVHLG